MASIGVQKNGNLFFDFRYQGHRCREYTKLDETKSNRKKMEVMMQRIEAEITLGSFQYKKYFPNSKLAEKFETAPALQQSNNAEDKTPLMKHFADEWFDENCIRWKRSYTRIIRGTLDTQLIPHFGDQSVGSITKADILKFRATLAKVTHEKAGKSMSNDRINHILTPLRMILGEAADRYDFTTPYIGIKALKVTRTDVDPFSLTEVQKIIHTVRSDFRNYYIVRFFTGMRTGEIDGLQWQYVDFENRKILVRETVVQGQIDSTKTLESRREIEISAPVMDALKAQKAATEKVSKFVFCNSKGEPLDHRNVTQRVWYPLLQYLGFKKRRPYQTRHTAATLWLGAGENPEWIAREDANKSPAMR